MNSVVEFIIISKEVGGIIESASTFIGNMFIKDVTFEEGIKKIGKYTFYNCWHLKKVTLPSTLQTIGDNAFYCTSREKVDYIKEYISKQQRLGDKKIVFEEV